MDPTDSEQVADAADAIRRYLSKRPHAIETVEGVARWWLLRQRHEDTQALAQSALDQLERQGYVERLNNTGAAALYRAAAPQ